MRNNSDLVPGFSLSLSFVCVELDDCVRDNKIMEGKETTRELCRGSTILFIVIEFVEVQQEDDY